MRGAWRGGPWAGSQGLWGGPLFSQKEEGRPSIWGAKPPSPPFLWPEAPPCDLAGLLDTSHLGGGAVEMVPKEHPSSGGGHLPSVLQSEPLGVRGPMSAVPTLPGCLWPRGGARLSRFPGGPVVVLCSLARTATLAQPQEQAAPRTLILALGPPPPPAAWATEKAFWEQGWAGSWRAVQAMMQTRVEEPPCPAPASHPHSS